MNVKKLKMDGAGENSTKDFKRWLADQGIEFEPPPPHIHTMNPKAERAIRTLKETTNALLAAHDLPKKYQAFAWCEAIRAHNATPSEDKETGEWKSPHERMYEKPPNMSNVVPFGSKCTAFIPPEMRRSDGERGFPAIVLQHTEHGYIVEDRLTKKLRHVNSILIQSNAINDQGDSIDSNTNDNDQTSTPPTPSPKNNDENTDIEVGTVMKEQEKEQSAPPRRSTRVTAKPARFAESALATAEKKIGLARAAYLASQLSDEDLHKQRKKDADAAEVQGLLNRGTFRKEKIPEGKRAIPSMMTCTIKYDRATGKIERYKSRLVLRGDLQEKGKDYFNSKAKVAILASFRVTQTIAAILDLPIIWADVPQAFCQSKMDVPTWTIPPQSTQLLTKEEIAAGIALRVVMSLYGSHQAAALWEKEYEKQLKKIGFKKLITDGCVHILKQGNEFMLTCIHVDDSCNIGSPNLMDKTLLKLKKIYNINTKIESDQGMGMRITRNRDLRVIVNSNPVMIEQLLQKYGMEHCNPKPTLLLP